MNILPLLLKTTSSIATSVTSVTTDAFSAQLWRALKEPSKEPRCWDDSDDLSLLITLLALSRGCLFFGVCVFLTPRFRERILPDLILGLQGGISLWCGDTSC